MITDAIPGTAKLAATGTLDFPLWEKTLPAGPAKARQARSQVIDKYSPDYLGKHPTPYTTSNYVEQSKFTGRHQTEQLSNTLDPTTFKRRTEAADCKLHSASTVKHPPAQLGGPAVGSITFTKAETSQGWNISTTQSYKDFAKAQAEFTKKAQAATMKKTTKLLTTYSTPAERETRRMETMRASKKEEKEYRDLLETAYGAESAAELIRLCGTQKRSTSQPLRPCKPSKADLEALRELDDFEPPAPRMQRSMSAVSEFVDETAVEES